jgi:hypothetical protein
LNLANEPDSEAPSGSKPKRRPITIDLPAEEVGRKTASVEASSSSAASAQAAAAQSGEGKVAAENSSAKLAGDRASDAKSEEKPAPTAKESPSAFATGRTGPSASPPKWRPIDDPPQRPAFVPMLVAAIIGALIAAFAVVGLSLSGYLSPKSNDGLAAEVEALKAEVASLKQAEPDGGFSALQQQVAALEQRVGEAAAATPGAPTEALKEIQDRIAVIEQRNGGANAPDELKAQLTKLTEDLASLRSATPADAATLESSLRPISEKLDQLSARVDELSRRIDAAPAEDRIAAIESKLGERSTKIDLAAALAPAVIADALEAAIESGRPFSAELAALKSLGVGGESVDHLAADGGTGVSTLAELRSAFETAIASTDLTPTAPETTGTIDRLLKSAQDLVEVRPEHPAEGTDPGAIVARIRAALDAGDLKRALQEWNSLPDALKAPMTDWAREVEVRAKADELVASVRSEALSMLGAGQ